MGSCTSESEVVGLLKAVYERVCEDTGSMDSKPCEEFRLVLFDLEKLGVSVLRRKYGI